MSDSPERQIVVLSAMPNSQIRRWIIANYGGEWLHGLEPHEDLVTQLECLIDPPKNKK